MRLELWRLLYISLISFASDSLILPCKHIFLERNATKAFIICASSLLTTVSRFLTLSKFDVNLRIPLEDAFDILGSLIGSLEYRLNGSMNLSIACSCLQAKKLTYLFTIRLLIITLRTSAFIKNTLA